MTPSRVIDIIFGLVLGYTERFVYDFRDFLKRAQPYCDAEDMNNNIIDPKHMLLIH